MFASRGGDGLLVFVGVVWFTLAPLVGAYIAKAKGRTEWEGALWGIFLGAVGWIIVGLLPEGSEGFPYNCPECDGGVTEHARRCRHCGFRFAPVRRHRGA
jgi:hypothetical protein